MRERRAVCLGLTFVAACVASALAGPPAGWARVVERVSVASGGAQAMGAGPEGSGGPALSADGRFVAFESFATNLVPGDTNEVSDIFVHDRVTGETIRVSVASGGTQAGTGGGSFGPTLSADGRFVAFWSYATDLVPGDTNEGPDVFLHDRLTGETTRVSVASGGGQAGAGSQRPTLSGDGRYVAFDSYAPDLVPDDTNEDFDVFVHDRLTGETARVSVSSEGAQATGGGSLRPALSADGRVVGFHSNATDLVPGDTDEAFDVFVHDRQTGETTRVSVGVGTPAAGSFDAALSADGRFVAFWSYDVFVHDRVTGETFQVSVPFAPGQAKGGHSRLPALSADGRFVAFYSLAPNLVPGDTNLRADVFVRDRMTGITTRVSVGAGGAQGDENSFSTLRGPALSADGRYVAFESAATNLVPDDTNDADDVFVAGPPALWLVIRGSDDRILDNRFDGTTWGGFVTLPGATADIPALASSGGGILDLVVRGIDDSIYWNHFSGGVWSGWTPLPGATKDIPALAASGGGILDLVVRGTDNGIYWNHYDGTAWSGWLALPGATASIPALVASGGGQLDLVVRGIDNGVYWNHYNGSSWSGWLALPGATSDIPALASSGGGILDLVVRGIDNGVYWNHYNGTAWSGWIPLPGATKDIPALAASGGGVLDLVVRGTDDGVYWNHYNGTAWRGWVPLPGATASIPALTASGGGKLDLAVRGTDDQVYHNHYNGTAWTGWTAVGGSTLSRPALAKE